jgi:WD40 repeat protein
MLLFFILLSSLLIVHCDSFLLLLFFSISLLFSFVFLILFPFFRFRFLFQVFLSGHTDDISCLALSSDGRWAATGCVGKKAVVLLWDTNVSHRAGAPPIATIGPGPFDRGVCAIEFSYDNRFLVAIGCDDTHLMTIFALPAGNKIIEMSSTHGEFVRSFVRLLLAS